MALPPSPSFSLSQRVATQSCGGAALEETDEAKGRRLVATRDFAKGEVVLVEEALLYAISGPGTALGKLDRAAEWDPEDVKAAIASLRFDSSSFSDIDEALKVASQLHPVKRSVDEGSSSSLSSSTLLTATDIHAILKSNGVAMRGIGADKSAQRGEWAIVLLLAACMLNHSCEDANCAWKGRWVERPFGHYPEFVVSATRDIRAAEELTICYLTDGGKGRERKERLLRSYGFSCDCRICNDGE